MYTVCVRDHLMIAHSLRGELFGPAQALHGATYVVDLEFRRAELDAHGLVVDIARAHAVLGELVGELSYSNLDTLEQFAGRNTTTEFLARYLFDRVAERVRAGALGTDPSALVSLKVTLHESHVAWAAFEGELGR